MCASCNHCEHPHEHGHDHGHEHGEEENQKTLLIRLGVSAALLILGASIFLSLWLDAIIGVLAGGAAFIVLVCVMIVINRKNK